MSGSLTIEVDHRGVGRVTVRFQDGERHAAFSRLTQVLPAIELMDGLAARYGDGGASGRVDAKEGRSIVERLAAQHPRAAAMSKSRSAGT